MWRRSTQIRSTSCCCLCTICFLLSKQSTNACSETEKCSRKEGSPEVLTSIVSIPKCIPKYIIKIKGRHLKGGIIVGKYNSIQQLQQCTKVSKHCILISPCTILVFIRYIVDFIKSSYPISLALTTGAALRLILVIIVLGLDTCIVITHIGIGLSICFSIFLNLCIVVFHLLLISSISVSPILAKTFARGTETREATIQHAKDADNSEKVGNKHSYRGCECYNTCISLKGSGQQCHNTRSSLITSHTSID